MVRLAYFVRTALVGLRRAPFVHGVAVLTIAVALFSAGLARSGAEAVQAVLKAWGGDVEVTVYLGSDATDDEIKSVGERLRSDTGADVQFVSAEVALLRLAKELGEAGSVLTSLPKNPLQASYEVRPLSGRSPMLSLAARARAWAALPGVEAVDYGREWVERLEGLAGAGRGTALALLCAVFVAAVVVVAATLQLAVYARREEIEIQKLVGATDAFVKAPLVIEGMLQGLAGALVAALGLWAFGRFVGPMVGEVLSLAAGAARPTLVNLDRLGELCAAGVLLGLFGSLLAVRRFLAP